MMLAPRPPSPFPNGRFACRRRPTLERLMVLHERVRNRNSALGNDIDEQNLSARGRCKI